MTGNKVTLKNPNNSSAVSVSEFFKDVPKVNADKNVLEVVDVVRAHGTFKSVTRTTAGTTTVTSADSNGSLLVTDIVVTGEKQAGSTVEVRFDDGTNNVPIILASQVDVPVSVAISFTGRVQGWRDARIDVITVGTADATVLVCYTKIPTGLPYAEWDSYR